MKARTVFIGIKELTADIEKIKKEIKTEVGQKGLDNVTKYTVKKLKEDLLDLVNSGVRFKTVLENKIDTEAKFEIDTTQILKDFLKEILKVDLDTIDLSKDVNNLDEKNPVFLIKDNRVILKIKISKFSEAEPILRKAADAFKRGIYVDLSKSTPQIYSVKNSFDIVKWVKYFCSTDTGITDKSKKRFEKYKDKEEAELRLRQAGVQELIKNSINITEVANLFLEGKSSEALEMLKNEGNTEVREYLSDKIENFSKNKTTVTEVSSIEKYQELIKFIKGIEFKKTIQEDKTRYSLESKKDVTETEDFEEFFNQLEGKLSAWFLFSHNKWFEGVVRKAKNIAKKYNKGA